MTMSLSRIATAESGSKFDAFQQPVFSIYEKPDFLKENKTMLPADARELATAEHKAELVARKRTHATELFRDLLGYEVIDLDARHIKTYNQFDMPLPANGEDSVRVQYQRAVDDQKETTEAMLGGAESEFNRDPMLLLALQGLADANLDRGWYIRRNVNSGRIDALLQTQPVDVIALAQQMLTESATPGQYEAAA